MILAGGQGLSLGVLTRHRPASAMPFGGKYRVIDFCLSNSSNSEIHRVAVLTQYAPASLNEHIATGVSWDLDRRDGGVKLLQAYGRRGGSTWYRGTADAIAQNLNVVENWNARWVVVASGDQVYKMDYSELVRVHQTSGYPVTMTVKQVPAWDCRRFGIVSLDGGGRVAEIDEKPAEPRGNLANLGVYVFDARLLYERLAPGVEVHDIVLDLIHPMVAAGLPVGAHVFDGYWDDIGTVDAYFRANMELLTVRPRLVLADPDWRIYTPSEERPPVKVGRGAEVTRSLVANGAIVGGKVVDSILFPGAVVAPGATVVSSIVMQETIIRRGAQVDLAILDKHIVVEEGAVVGHGDAGPEREEGEGEGDTRAEGGTQSSSVVVVGKNAVVPAGCRVGRRCEIDVGARPADYPTADLAPGTRVVAKEPAMAAGGQEVAAR
jgi:glucose-1-phosphate adenylyltransferase